MDFFDKLRHGYYDCKFPYARPVKEVPQKDILNYVANHREASYREAEDILNIKRLENNKEAEVHAKETARLKELMHDDFCKEHCVNKDNSLVQKLYSIAWNESHAYGYWEVYQKFSEYIYKCSQEIIIVEKHNL